MEWGLGGNMTPPQQKMFLKIKTSWKISSKKEQRTTSLSHGHWTTKRNKVVWMSYSKSSNVTWYGKVVIMLSLRCCIPSKFYNWWTRFHWSNFTLPWLYLRSNSAHPWLYKRSTTKNFKAIWLVSGAAVDLFSDCEIARRNYKNFIAFRPRGTTATASVKFWFIIFFFF